MELIVLWFTSDNHFFHKNIIRLSGRPFSGLAEMHEYMIQEWNKRIKPTEKVYVLGDFSFANVRMTERILSRLMGYKILIKGNHDMPAHKCLAAGFQEVHENIFIELNGKKIFLSHFPYHPMKRYNKNPDGSVYVDDGDHTLDRRYLHKRIVDDGQHFLLHGHVHGAYRQRDRQINVGVDAWGYKPVSHEKLINMIEEGEQEILIEAAYDIED
jgi:calcineurin-like phosphoesterase family protein